MLLKTVQGTMGFVLFLLQMAALKIHHRPKPKGQGLQYQELHTWLYSENDRPSTERNENFILITNSTDITTMQMMASGRSRRVSTG
jgi:hypothetical protein